ncbi:MAG: ribosome maturation factor RimM [Anaeroplasmataceae bacterium]
MNYYKIGTILNTHGLKGDLKVKVISDFNRFKKNVTVYCLLDNNYVELTINSVKEYDKNILVTFKELLDINKVLIYKNKDLYIKEEQREKLSNDDFYYTDLLNKDVYNTNNELKGVVIEVREVPQGHILVIKQPNSTKNGLIPFRKEFVLEVLEDKIIINQLEGLL